METLKAIEELQLNRLPREWVDCLWSTDFEEEKEIPQQYNSHPAKYAVIFNNLANAIDGWNNGESSCMQELSDDAYKKSWHTLIKNKVDYKALLALISAFIRTDVKEILKNKRSFAFSSSRVYFALLSIPGALPCNIFNSNLYEYALKTFINTSCLLSIKSQNKSKGKRKKPGRVGVPDLDGSELAGDEVSEEEQLEILRQICLMLDGLSNCLKELSLKDEDDSLSLTAQVLVKLTQLECGLNVYSDSPKPNSLGMVVLKSYNILEQLCNSVHGEVEQTIKLIMRFFLPTLVINEENIKIAVKSNVSANENTICFIRRLLSNVKEGALHGIKVVIQQLCVRMPDRSDIRAKAIPQITQLLELLPYDVFEGMMLWIVSLAHSETVKYRLCAIDLISKVLNASDIPEASIMVESTLTKHTNVMNSTVNDGVNSHENRNQIKRLYKFLLGAILSRSLDSSPVLRSKCLNIFGLLVLTKQSEIKEIMQELFVTPYYNFKLTLAECNEKYFDFQNYFSTNSAPMVLPHNPLPSGLSIMQHTELLSKDEKVFVRKNALQLICNVCLLNKYWLSSRRLEILVASSRDISLMIRKLIVKCLTDILVLYPSNKVLVQSWVKGVVSLIADSDIKCQEKVIESLKSVIVDNLAAYEKTNSPDTKLPWTALSVIALAEKRIFFKLACRTWSINKSITKKTFKSLQSHIGTENNFAAWFFIVCLCEFDDFPSPRVLADYFFENVFSHKADETLSQLVVEAVFLNWKGFDSQTQSELCTKIKSSLETFSVPLCLISRYLDICYHADRNKNGIWCGSLVKLSETYLKESIAPECSNDISEEALCCYIHTLGDAVHFYPGVSFEVVNYLANVIDPTFVISECVGPAPYFVIYPAASNRIWKGSVSEAVKAVAIVALGKLCLQDLMTSKRFSPVFARVLNGDSTTAVKINAMAALSDLCVRFSSVVEDHLGDLCVMLKDPDIQVRRQSLKFLLHQIMEDFVKPKGAVFFYLLIMLRDPVSSVREIVESFFTNMLLNRNPSIMCHYFIQAIFFFNDYLGSGSFNKNSLSAREKKVFSMSGTTNFYDRGQIYKFMLCNMRDDHRFKLSNRICADILDEIIDHKISLDRTGVAVLKDCLFALACDEMRLENLRKVDDDSHDRETDEVQDIGGGEAVLGIAKKVFISQIVKANYVECIVPTFSKLKRMLTELKSPLVRDLMMCLRELMKDFRNEINDILHADPELAAEVALDLKDLSQEEDTLSDRFACFNIREVRAQCEQLSEKALCEKMGILTPLSALRSRTVSVLRPSPLDTEIQLPSSIQRNLPIQRSPMQCLRRRESTGNSRSGSFSSLSSQHSAEDSSSVAHHSDSHSLSPSFSSGGEERTLSEKQSFPFEDKASSVHGKKRSSDETHSVSPGGFKRENGRGSNKSDKNVVRKKKK